MTALSVVIPTLNEAAALPLLLADLDAQQDCAFEVIVADGGSTDGTVADPQAAGVRVVTAPRGRAAQMNAGAAAARGAWLLFLHADTRLPSPTLLRDALAAVQAAGPRAAGHFPLRFQRAEPGHDFFFAYLEGKTALNRPWTVNGDQGCLIARGFFAELGGFDERLPFLEDQRLAQRVFERGRWIVLPGHLVTSARRFESEGHRRRYTLMALMMALHEAGADEFFREAPQAYATQDRAAPLDLAPFLRLIRRLLWRARWRRALEILWRCGRFARRNAWQLAYRRDIARGRADRPALAYFDRRIARLLDNPAADALATLLVCAWFFLWAPVASRHN